MFEINDGDNVQLEGNVTSKDSILIAKNTKNIYASNNKAGVGSEKNSKRGIYDFLWPGLKLLAQIFIGVLIIYIGYIFKWN